MSYRNTQVGQEIQLNGLGNSLAANPQGTTVQLGALNNSASFYKDVNNPCQSYQQTNYMGSFRDRNLIYITGSGQGLQGVQITAPYFSLFGGPVALFGTSAFQVHGGGDGDYKTGTIRCDGNFYGSGGAGGAGSSSYGPYGVNDPGQPGRGGRAGIEFQGGLITTIRVQAGTFFGGGGGGGGGAGGLNYNDDNGTTQGYGGGDSGHIGYPGQNAGYGAGGGGQGARGRRGFQHAGGGGSGGQYGQSGQPGQGSSGLDTPNSPGAGGYGGQGIQGAYSINYY